MKIATLDSLDWHSESRVARLINLTEYANLVHYSTRIAFALQTMAGERCIVSRVVYWFEKGSLYYVQNIEQYTDFSSPRRHICNCGIVPGIIILILGNFYLSSLTQRGQAVATSFDAQSIASQQQNNLERMNALTQTLHNNIFASLGQNVKDPSLGASGALINGDILSRDAAFQQSLKDYQSTYDLANSPNMDTVRTIIQRDNPTSGVIQDQQDALNLVINQQWPTYDKLQEKVLNQLQYIETNYIQPDPKTNVARPPLTPDQINALYEQVYPNLYQANLDFSTLR